MNLTSPSQVKDWCISNGFHPNKVLGQNFLIDKNALDSILDAALVSDSSLPTTNCQLPTKTLEIGPGLGVLTEGLLERGCAVTAIEKDPVLADRLKASLGNPEGLTVLKGDALDYIKEGACDGFPLMVSNLPYQAGTRILIEIIDRIGKFEAPETIVVLVQTEVAERLAACEGSKTRGLAGVRVQFDYDVQIVRKVAASCFWPRPEIGSSVVKLVRHHRNDNVGEDVRRKFKWLTKRAFEHRRKQLGSTFKGIIESTARAEQLTNEDWLALAEAVSLDFL
jgi:16S rRNA (adenine1518-N6/adenine1519-N6)-dimethyltransferase